jgi:hypothetical protein
MEIIGLVVKIRKPGHPSARIDTTLFILVGTHEVLGESGEIADTR